MACVRTWGTPRSASLCRNVFGFSPAGVRSTGGRPSPKGSLLVIGKLWKVVKFVALTIGLLVLLGVGVGVFLAPSIMDRMEMQRTANSGTEVQTTIASEDELTRVVAAPGRVRARNSVNITSRVSAKIVELPFEAGDVVSEGDIVARLDSKDIEAALQGARARMLADEASLRSSEANLEAERSAIAGLKAQLDRAVADFERTQTLFESGDVSEQQLDADRAFQEQRQADYDSRIASLKGAEANVEASRARVAVSQAEVTRAEENVAFTVIRSPIDGVITRVNSREGEVALGTIQNVGSTIMIIADLSEMQVIAEIPETDVARVKEGQAADVVINGYADDRFRGTLRKMALESQPGSDGTNIFQAEIVLHLEERRMFAGLTANVDIEVETISELIVVPSQAVLDKRVDNLPKEIRDTSTVLDQTRTFAQVVFVRDDQSVARLRPVKVEASNLRETGISAGVEIGDEIIIGPFRSLQDLKHGTGVKLEGADEEEAQVAEDDEADDDDGVSAETATASTAG